MAIQGAMGRGHSVSLCRRLLRAADGPLMRKSWARACSGCARRAGCRRSGWQMHDSYNPAWNNHRTIVLRQAAPAQAPPAPHRCTVAAPPPRHRCAIGERGARPYSCGGKRPAQGRPRARRTGFPRTAAARGLRHMDSRVPRPAQAAADATPPHNTTEYDRNGAPQRTPVQEAS